MIYVPFRSFTFAILALAAVIATPALNLARAQMPQAMQSQAPVSFQQQYQVLFLQNNVAGSATFLFTSDTLNADGTTSGAFTANVEGNLIQGRFLALDSGSESLWVVQAAGAQAGFVARGWKTQDRLVGEGTVSLAANGQVFQQTFFLLGQGVMPLAQAPANVQPPATAPSAQPNAAPNAPDARPSLFAQP
jgi:hypothetical protein